MLVRISRKLGKGFQWSVASGCRGSRELLFEGKIRLLGYRLPKATAWVELFRNLTRYEFALVGLVALGVALRVLMIHRWPVVYDGATMATMGWSLVKNGEFLVPYAEGTVYYRHYPPLYPVYLSMWYAAFGFSAGVTQVASLSMALLFLLVVFMATRDLFGRSRALYATAFVALEPMLVLTTGLGYAESLVSLLLVLTVWAVLKSLRNPRYVVLAGLFAGLGYLAKASMGPVFLVAGVAGLAWRLRHMGLAVFRDRWYLAAMGIFGALVGGWTLRNLARYGWPHWETSAHIANAYTTGLAQPELLALGLAAKAVWFVGFFLFLGGAFWPELRRSLRRLREEAMSGLWLAVLLVFGLGAVVASFLWTVEGRTLLWHSDYRYAVVVAPVLLWILFREGGPFRATGRPWRRWWRILPGRAFAFVPLFLILNVGLAAFPAPYGHLTAVEELGAVLQQGDIVAVQGIPPEMVLPYMPYGVSVVPYRVGLEATYLLTTRPEPSDGFVLVGEYLGQDLLGEAYLCYVWRRP